MRRLTILRVLPCLLAIFCLVLSPLATVHAHVSAHHATVITVIHGGHSHDEGHSHAADRADIHADDFSGSHSALQFEGHLSHNHAIDGYIVHCDVLAVQLDTSSKTKTALGHRTECRPLAFSRLIFKPPEPIASFIAQRFYLHPPLRGPPAHT